MLQSDVVVKNSWYRGLLAHTCHALPNVDRVTMVESLVSLNFITG